MAFDVTLLQQVLDVGQSSPRSVWMYGASTRTTNSSTECAAVGFFAGCGAGGRGANTVGMRLGDVVVVNAATGTTFSSTGRVTVHNVIGSTADQASTLAATGFAASYNVTISAGSSI